MNEHIVWGRNQKACLRVRDDDVRKMHIQVQIDVGDYHVRRIISQSMVEDSYIDIVAHEARYAIEMASEKYQYLDIETKQDLAELYGFVNSEIVKQKGLVNQMGILHA